MVFRTIIVAITLMLFTADSFSQTIIQMERSGGVYYVPCTVNGLELKFIFDTGAGDVSISLSEALFMIKNGYMNESDLIGTEYYRIANGEVAEGTGIIIRELKIGGKTLYNVKASVVHTLSAPLLLGQSAIERFGKFTVDYSNNLLILGSTSISSSKQISAKGFHKAHLMEPIYTSRKSSNYNNKFFHIGIGAGFDWMMFSALADRTEGISGGNNVVSGQSSVNIIGLGFKGEFVLHPYMRDHFSLGFISGGAVGTTPMFIRGGQKTTDTGDKQEEYMYTRFEIGGEIAAGSKPIKALFTYKSSIQKHDFQQEIERYSYTTKYDFTCQVRKEILSAGMRLAPYLRDDKNNKRGFCWDFTYNLSRDYPWNWSELSWSYTPLSDWNHGCGFTLWVQSVLKIQFDVILKSQLGSSAPSSAKSSYYQLSFIYNRNAFL